jgi:hypothetical protein
MGDVYVPLLSNRPCSNVKSYHDLTAVFGTGVTPQNSGALLVVSLRLRPRPFPPLVHVSLSVRHFTSAAMAIQKEPGQKGVNWSNIAVGTFAQRRRRLPARSRAASMQVAL